MSWSILRKQVRGAFKPDLDPHTNEASQLVDKLVIEFEELENCIKSIHLNAKKIPDALIALEKFDIKLAEELSNFGPFKSDRNMKLFVDDCHKVASDFTSMSDDFVIQFQRNFLNALKQLKSNFAEMKVVIRHRETIYHDVIKFNRKVLWYKERERTGTNLVKLEEAKRDLAASKEEYSKRTIALSKYLSKFLSDSHEMFHPSLEAFVNSEINWIRSCKISLDSQTNLTNVIKDNEYERKSYYRVEIVRSMFDQLNSLSMMAHRSTDYK